MLHLAFHRLGLCIFKKCEAEHWWKSSEKSYRSCRLYSRSWHARGHHHPWHHRWHHAWHLIKEASWNIHLAFPYHLVQAQVSRHSVRQGVCVYVESCLQLGGEGETETESAVLIYGVMPQLAICEAATHHTPSYRLVFLALWSNTSLWQYNICLLNLTHFALNK